MSTRPPAALHTAALCMAIFGTLAAVVAVALVPGRWTPSETMWVRGVMALLAAFSWAAFEALWRQRPWAWRASLALACAWAAAVTALFVALRGSVSGWIGTMQLSACVVLPLIAAVRHGLAGLLHPAARHRRSAPRP